MDLSAASTAPTSGRREQVATRLVFFAVGFASGAWAPLVPFARQRLGGGDSELGLLLLCLGAGSILAMPTAGALAARIGYRAVLTVAAMAMAACFALLAWVGDAPGLAATLFVFGAALGSVDCVVNIQAIVVERDSGRPMMSGFHALYSLGGIAGAGGMSAMLAGGSTPLTAAGCVTIALVIVTAVARPGMLARRGEPAAPAFAVPHGAVVLIGAFCFVLFLAEGSALDWSAVLLRTVRGADPAQAGLAYVGFAAAMTTGRLCGDPLVRRIGGLRAIVFGCSAAAGGLTIAALAPAWPAAVAGYVLVGAGCSNVVPVLFTSLGRQTAMPLSQAAPAASVMGYAGILAGPAAIGVVAGLASLPIALLIVAALLAAVAASARVLRL